MAAFIVISTEERLSWIVDGIVSDCLPQNPNVDTFVSTGCVMRYGEGFKYYYNIHGEKPQEDESDSSMLSELLIQQVAQFRTAYGLTGQIKVFLLQNPLTMEEYGHNHYWLREIEKLNDADNNLFFFHTLFLYDTDNPCDVNRQMPKDLLRLCLREGEGFSYRYNSRFMVLDNHTLVAAALCLDDEEYRLKLPRALADFMMLVSNENSVYRTMSHITDIDGDGTYCFSFGYAECMYYYPDVERYFVHADRRDLLRRMLTADDEAEEELSDENAMDVDAFPFGLCNRRNRLKKYGDVPFSESVDALDGYADKIIDDCLMHLKETLMEERKQEFEAFMQSKEMAELTGRLDKLCGQRDEKENQGHEGEGDEEFDALQAEIDEVEERLKEKQNGFKPDCPDFISRGQIFMDYQTAMDDPFTDPQETEEKLRADSAQYDELVRFAIGKKMVKYVREHPDPPLASITALPPDGVPAPRRGCCPAWVARLMGKKKEEPPVKSLSETPPETPKTSFDLLKEILRMRKLKKAYASFEKRVEDVRKEYEKEADYCEHFKLTTHVHNYRPLIDMDKLRDTQEEGFEERLNAAVEDWRLKKTADRPKLEECVEKQSKRGSKRYRWVDWEKPFSFVIPITEDTLALLCNGMANRSAPFVNCLDETAPAEDSVGYVLYSSREHFDNEVSQINGQLRCGNNVTAVTSQHIESKICMMQFLIMDEAMVQRLCQPGEKQDEEMVSLPEPAQLS